MRTKNKSIILAVRDGTLSVKAAAHHFEVSERWVKELMRRYAYEGEVAFEPRSRRPKTSPHQTPETVRQRIIELRNTLEKQGLDAGAETLQIHLSNEELPVPAKSTIHRILRAEKLVIDEPKKRPKASFIRFESPQPNAMWQADVMEWKLHNGIAVDILTFLDDHARFMLSSHAYKTVTTPIVVTQFTQTCQEHGKPAATLTDNGVIFTTRFVRNSRGDDPAKNRFEKLLKAWDIKQINGAPYHPQTQGKIERFHRTYKQWLRAQPRAKTLAELNQQLQAFQHIYNYERPHRAANRKPPIHKYQALPKAAPTPQPVNEYRIRNDVIDKFGKVTLRYDGKLRHLGVGVKHAGKEIRMLIDNQEVMIADKKTGEIICYFEIDPEKDYQKQKPTPNR